MRKILLLFGCGLILPGWVAAQTRVGMGTRAGANADTSVLNEVVVVAYGQVKRTTITGSVVMINGADVADKPFTSVDKVLQGAIAGVEVSSVSGAPGSSTDIRIRGIGSITASADPLWVIDGVEATTGVQSSNTTTSNVLATLNPDDIESISVLKDAASTAIYGSRGSNGVIIVTTKRGKAGPTRVHFTAGSGQNSQAFHPANRPETSVQYQTTLRAGVINAGHATTNAGADAYISSSATGLGYPANWAGINTNWRNVVTQNGNQSQYNLSVSGGTDKMQVYVSGGWFNGGGNTLGAGFRRYNGTMSITYKLTNRITASVTMMTGYSLQHTPLNGPAYGNPVLESFLLLPWYTPRNPDGSLRYGANDSPGEFPLLPSVYNPLVEAAYNFNSYRQVSLRGNVQVVYKILDPLVFTTRYSGEYADISEDQYENPFYGDGYSVVPGAAGKGLSVYTRIYDWTWSNYFDFHQRLNRGGTLFFDLKPGYEVYEYNNYNLQAGGQGYPQALGLSYLTSAATPTTASVLPTSSATLSEFIMGEVNFKNRYVVSGSFRRDGSSVFGADHQYGNFFSVGGAWNLRLLKLRSSYGETGNQLGFGLYSPLATYSYGDNYNGLPGSYPNNVGNPTLTWERNKIFNIGTDFGLLKKRITGTVEWYDRQTTQLLLAVPLSLTSGVLGAFGSNPTQLENAGGLANKGIEVELGGRPIVTRGFSWSVSFNIAHNTNRVTRLYANHPVPAPTLPNGAAAYFQYTVGHDFQTYYMPQWAGVDPSTGLPLWYADATRKTVTSTYADAPSQLNDRYTGTPTIFGAFTNDFHYKGFSLDVQVNYNYGNYLYDTWGFLTNSDGVYLGGYNQMNRQLRAWTAPGQKAGVPQIIMGRSDNSNGLSTRYLYKGDYVRLRNVQFGYTLPKRVIGRLRLSVLSVYMRGTNLLTFATDKYLPYDPEAGSASSTNFEVFIPKTVTGGVTIGF